MEKKYCLNCGKEIPTVKTDTFGRVNTRVSKFCENGTNFCRNMHMRKVVHPDYYKEYYKNHPEKYKTSKKVKE